MWKLYVKSRNCIFYSLVKGDGNQTKQVIYNYINYSSCQQRNAEYSDVRIKNVLKSNWKNEVEEHWEPKILIPGIENA